MILSKPFSEAELEALRQASQNISINSVEEKNSKDFTGTVIPGMSVYKKLIKMGLMYFTEEEDPFTPYAELTEAGKEAYNQRQL